LLLMVQASVSSWSPKHRRVFATDGGLKRVPTLTMGF
jgi:hypothetical protein